MNKKEAIEKKLIDMFIIKINNRLTSINNIIIFRDDMKKHLEDIWEEAKREDERC